MQILLAGRKVNVFRDEGHAQSLHCTRISIVASSNIFGLTEIPDVSCAACSDS